MPSYNAFTSTTGSFLLRQLCDSASRVLLQVTLRRDQISRPHRRFLSIALAAPRICLRRRVYIIYGHGRSKKAGGNTGDCTMRWRCSTLARLRKACPLQMRLKSKSRRRTRRSTSQLFLLRAFYLCICHRLALSDAEIFDIL